MTIALAPSAPESAPAESSSEGFRRRRETWWLVGTVLAAVAPSSAMPAPGLDPSWVAALNLAGSYHLRFGTDLVFTYGPLGFLDHPLAVAPHLAIAAFVFQAVVAVLLWLSLRAAARPVLDGHRACALASVTTVVLIGTVPPSVALLASALYFGTEYVRAGPDAEKIISMTPYALSSGAGLILLVKTSDGVALSTIAGLATALGPPPRRLQRCGIAVSSLVTTTVASWLLSQHSIGGLPRWIAGSASLAAGYSDAMSNGYEGDAQALIAAVVLAVLLSYLTLRARSWRANHLRETLGSTLLLVAAVFYGLKAGFVRSDHNHRADFVVVLIPLAIRLVAELSMPSVRLRRLAPVAFAATLALAAGPMVGRLNAVADARAFAEGAHAAVDGGYRHSLESSARASDRASYAVPHRMIDEIGDAPVAIDPWEVTVAWAYRLRWRPAPVFQIYASFTPSLDRAEARFLVQAPADQYVLRQRDDGARTDSGTGSVQQMTFAAPTVDGRNPAWESPRYQLALYCNYRVVDSSQAWILFRKGVDRCDRPTEIGTARVTSSRPVKVPTVSFGEVVVMSFHEDADQRSRLETFLFRSTHRLYASCDSSSYRLPPGMADGPLIVAGTRADATSVTTCSSVTFNSSGSVTFHAIPVR